MIQKAGLQTFHPSRKNAIGNFVELAVIFYAIVDSRMFNIHMITSTS